MVIPDLVGGIRNLLCGSMLNIDQAVIDDVVKTLHTSSSDSTTSRFPDLHVPESSFGGSSRAPSSATTTSRPTRSSPTPSRGS